jgi:HNH endonuclease/AP2 domain
VLCALAQVSDTGFVRKVGSNRLINVVCSESGHLQADWESKINGKRTHFKRYISKMVFITHHGAIGKDSKGRDLKVDHVDEDSHNNHVNNLRLLTHEVSLLQMLSLLHMHRLRVIVMSFSAHASANCGHRVIVMSQDNRRRSTNINSNNSSGVTGVSYDITNGVWKAYITVDVRKIYLGNFESIEGAAAARDAAELKYKYGKYHDTASINRDDTADTVQ